MIHTKGILDVRICTAKGGLRVANEIAIITAEQMKNLIYEIRGQKFKEYVNAL